MQAMVCKDRIGWRDMARRILIFSTDAKFHHAGDGRLAGVVLPNDEQCHLDGKGEYTAFDKYDYPSIGQINKVAKDTNINIIFAVLAYTDLYEELSKHIETSSFGKLKNGSLNVVDLIKDQYNSISSSVALTDNSTSDVAIKYRSSCKGDGPLQEVKKCEKISEKDVVTFELEITAKNCPASGESSIVAVKTLEDTVILDIDFLCSCNCPQTVGPVPCKNGGALVCGVCECAEGYSGEKCDCGDGDDGSYGPSEDQDANCKASEQDTKHCSGRGTCKCGMCQCHHEEVTGSYCECNRRKCKGPKGVLCSGHGRCDCEKCLCDEGYSGDHCNCDDRACRQKETDKECSGRGECNCGKCDCSKQENATYTGEYCERCLSCGTGQCNKFKDCVQCEHFGIGPRQHDCNSCETTESVESLDEYLINSKGFRLCTIEDAEDCLVNFTYRYVEATRLDQVFVQTGRQCPEAAPILSIVFGLIGAIVGIGVLTLIIWKFVTSIHDQREYAKFEQERAGATFNAEENPLYTPASTTTQNPMFENQLAN
ncbi:Integrin beta-PS [Chionoecetes opilio]|uniref:Integrin beta n=1 Tax=Chionoecetes opilio TaxID=41210 RepID=A0A8J4Y828_CHIOP|nr:Integrin beta-PS [Chionoecetes opilio]